MKSTTVTRHEFSHRGYTLSYLDSAPDDDQAPVALLLHGFPDSAAMWQPQIEALSNAGYRVIAPDTLGCGESQMGSSVSDYQAKRVASDHATLLDHLNINAAHVAGHDWGAVIAWFFAGYHPNKTRSLCAMSVGHPTAYARSGLAQKVKGWYTLFFQLPIICEWLLLRNGIFSLRQIFGSHPTPDEVAKRISVPGRLTAAIRLYRANLLTVLLEKQPRIKAPTLGVWSTEDAFLVESQMTKSHQYVDAEWDYLQLEGNHWMSIVQPGAVNTLLIDHFAKHASSTPSIEEG